MIHGRKLLLATVFCLVGVGVATVYVHSVIAQYQDAAPCGEAEGLVGLLQKVDLVRTGSCPITPRRTCANIGGACTVSQPPGSSGPTTGHCYNSTTDTSNPCQCIIDVAPAPTPRPTPKPTPFKRPH